MEHRSIVSAGGLCFVIGALAFVIRLQLPRRSVLDYPGILDGSAAEVLPRLRAGGSTMRAIWAIYAFLPLLLVPGAVGAYFACPSSRGRMITLVVPGQEGALVKDTPDPQVAADRRLWTQRIGVAPRPGIGRAGRGAARRIEGPDRHALRRPSHAMDDPRARKSVN